MRSHLMLISERPMMSMWLRASDSLRRPFFTWLVSLGNPLMLMVEIRRMDVLVACSMVSPHESGSCKAGSLCGVGGRVASSEQ